MTRERWEQVEQIFLAAVEIPEAERERFLSERCGGDGSLRHEVESLISARKEAEGFLDKPAMELAAGTFPGEVVESVAPGQMAGAYRVLSRLGAGGMGEVWRARDTRIDRDVALKFCGEQFTNRFESEARIIGALNHPNICQLYDVGPNYLVMELVEGESPAGPLPLETALGYARQIADALDAAHESGIVHQDLKPDNIKVRSDGTIKVLDFGIARFSTRGLAGGRNNVSASMPAAQPGALIGTAAYMSPEQLKGEEIDKRADIWAFGVLLFELLTGEQPFAKGSFPEVRSAVLTTEPDWERLPAEIRDVVRRCLEKDRKKRLRDIGDLASFPHPTKETPDLRRRTPWLAWTGWITAVLLTGMLWMAWRQGRSEGKALVRLVVDLGGDVSLSPAGGDPILSPDGNRIAYVSRGQVFTQRLDESGAHELAAAQGGSSLFFSPDGQWIAFFGGGKLRKISVNGGEAIEICRSNAAFTGGSWGEDGNIIAALSASGGLSQVSAAGGEPHEISTLNVKEKEASHRLPQILPGGKAVVFTVHTSIAGFDDARIDVMSLRDGRRETLVRGGTFGRYLPSGHLVYVSRGRLFAVPFDPDRLELRGKPVPVLDQVIYSPQFGSASIAFSRSGTLIYRDGEVGMRMITAHWLDAQGKTEPLLTKPGMYMDPRLSPDGNRLAFAVGEGPDRGLWVYDWRRETTSRLTPSEGIFRTPVWTLRVPVCAAAFSCRQPGSFSPGKVQTVAEEFHKDYGFCGSGEKFRKGTAEGNGHDLFRGGQPSPNRTDPGTKGKPY